MNIFEYEDYKALVMDRIKTFPSGGHGVLTRISEASRTPLSTLSLVFKSKDRELTTEQAVDVAEFFGLNYLEKDYFLALVERKRAGSPGLRAHIEERISGLRKKASTLQSRIVKRDELGTNEKYIFYSEWYYSAANLLTRVPGFQRASAIAAFLNLPLGRVNQVMEFLTSCGLVREKESGFSPGKSSTHIGAEDPLVYRHHQNWRQQSLRRLADSPTLEENELCVSLPCTTSDESLRKIRAVMLEAIAKTYTHISEGDDESLAFINVDILKIKGRTKSKQA